MEFLQDNSFMIDTSQYIIFLAHVGASFILHRQLQHFPDIYSRESTYEFLCSISE